MFIDFFSQKWRKNGDGLQYKCLPIRDILDQVISNDKVKQHKVCNVPESDLLSDIF